MTRQRKLLERFLSKPRDFSFSEMERLLNGFGYHEIRSGKTAGSRVALIHEKSRHIIRLHKPHSGMALKRYQLDLIEEELRNQGIIR